MINVLFICHGNICRSPMAEFMFVDMVKKAGLTDKIHVASCATSREAIGWDTHSGTRKKLTEEGVPMYPRRAVQLRASDYEKYDYLIAMDSQNIRNIRRIIKDDPEGKIFTLLQFAGSERDIADPWYTDNFDKTYEDIKEGLTAFMAFVREKYGI